MDGYIARSDGDVDWLDTPAIAPPEGEDFGYAKFYESIDTTLMGSKTFEFVDQFEGPFPYPEKKNYVFSQSERQPNEWVEFVSRDPVAFMQDLRRQKGLSIWLVGGGLLNTFFLKNGLIDRIILTKAPIILGSGIPLFNFGNFSQLLELTQTQIFDKGWVQLTYDLKPRS